MAGPNIPPTVREVGYGLGPLPVVKSAVGDQIIDFNLFEVIDQPLWDSQTLASAQATTLTLFQVPVGQGGKTVVDTNMEIAGQLTNPKNELVGGISVVANSDVVLAQLQDLTGTAVLRFKQADKNIFILPVHMLGKAMLSGFSGTAAFDFAGLGDPGVRYGYPLRYPFVIVASQAFQVEILFGTALGVITNLKIWVYLHGIQTRAIK
ncbi:MAG: hypothetical protein Q8O94_02755 [bacterium]|nr:hypothetical protein [bacterium]